MSEINTHGMRIEFGKYRGQRVTRLPVDYLEWLINEGAAFTPIAKAELQRRGVTPGHRQVEISNHAIDRASLRMLDLWQREHKPNEGLHGWLTRVCIEALSQAGTEDAAKEFKIYYADMVLAFKRGELYPTLTTVMKPEIQG